MFANEGENIVAIATPKGAAALAIIRISGKNLYNIYKSLSKKEPKNRFAQFSKIYHPKSGLVLDESIITYFKSPESFTGEDIIEITCHGGVNIKRSIINACNAIGIKNAERGEFSYRAFMNGKIDLVQAEAIASLISSQTSKSAQHSLMHLKGKVSQKLNNIKNQILKTLTIIENELNFSEEEISYTSLETLATTLNEIKIEIQEILQTSTAGKKIFSGIRVILLGKPNVGKSTLFNSILGEDRTIISDEAGTTRDTIESWFELEGTPICLIDTAGIWEAKDGLDKLGIKKTISEIDLADICIIIDDINPSNFFKNTNIIEENSQKCIFVKSKSDLNNKINNKNNKIINISSKTNTGIDHLLTEISKHIVSNFDISTSDEMMINRRQFQLLKESSVHINSAIKQIKEKRGADILASTLHSFVDSIKEIVGEVPNKEIINKIFNDFCIGK